ncbi:MAG TPA: DUF2207 domain-containing protein [Longimicrobiales bacterium]|nr:DUF2207 domain-containing protein [Longimicrobiales bacterium]
MTRLPSVALPSALRRAGLAALLLAVLLAGGAGPLAAQGRSLDIRDFSASMTVRRNGTMIVREQITVHFDGEWNGIYRTIPLEYRTEHGLNYTLRVRIRGARDDAGATLRHELDRERGNLQVKIWVPNARDAVRTVTLEYEVRNGLRFFEQHDELYWNVTGTEWSYPIRAASAEVYLPPEVTGIRTTAYTGAYGAAESEAATEQVGNMVRFRTTRELGLREGLTIVVGWDPGVVARPSGFARAAGFVTSNLLLLAPLLVGFGMHALWRRHGRDPELGSIAARYEPPEGLTPAEVGTLLDLRVDMRDITATLVDLAVRGYVRIEETDRAQLFGLISSRDYVFVRLMPESACVDLKEHERDLLDALFTGGSSVQLSELENRFYKRLPGVKDSLTAALVRDGYYVHNPHTVRALFLGAAVLVAVVIVMFGGWLAARHGTAPATGIIAGVLSGLVVAIVGWFMPARTARGTQVLREIRGFEEFVERVELDRMTRLVDRPELFEKYLPFAMAFGLEKRWARAFDGIFTEPPTWYHSRHAGPFRTGMFISDLGRMSQATSSTLRSAPRSSSGSSGFGGGSSGGGFGGGGGGGF